MLLLQMSEMVKHCIGHDIYFATVPIEYAGLIKIIVCMVTHLTKFGDSNMLSVIYIKCLKVAEIGFIVLS